jgi:hypothetical protein
MTAGTISNALRARVRAQAGNRCGYCLARQEYVPWLLEIEHIVRLFNPRRQRWKRHFRWSEDGALIIGRTICGRATVVALNLNNLVAVTVRRNWIIAGWHPPQNSL